MRQVRPAVITSASSQEKRNPKTIHSARKSPWGFDCMTLGLDKTGPKSLGFRVWKIRRARSKIVTKKIRRAQRKIKDVMNLGLEVFLDRDLLMFNLQRFSTSSLFFKSFSWLVRVIHTTTINTYIYMCLIPIWIYQLICRNSKIC